MIIPVAVKRLGDCARRFGAALAIASLLLVSTRMTAAAEPQTPDNRQLVVELARVGDVIARLRVLKAASMDQQDWMALELENRGKEPVELGELYYQMDRLCVDRKGKPVVSGGLASGSTYDLFPEAWATTPVKVILLQPGTRTFAAQPSDYAATLLGLPPPEGWLVRATVSLRLEVKGQGRSEAVKAQPFEFEWLYPDAAGFERMRARLKTLLTQSEPKSAQGYFLGALLQVPEVARSASVRELLAALDNHRGPFSGGNWILRYLDKHHSADAEVVADFQRRLDAGDRSVLERLWGTQNIWSAAFVEPLLRMYEKYPLDDGKAIEIFEMRGQGKPADQAVAQRLSAAWLKEATFAGKKPAELPLERRSTWSHQVGMLGKTRDLSMIARLEPLLDDKTIVQDEAHMDRLATGAISLTRACHVAMEAILTILDGSLKAQAQAKSAGYWFREKDVQSRLKAAIEIRDKATAALKLRLATLRREAKPADVPTPSPR